MDYYTVSSNDAFAMAGAALLALAFFGFLALILYGIPAIITLWKLFTKAGKPGWAVIVPVYNQVVMGEIGGAPVWVGWTAGICGLGSGLFGQNSTMSNLLSLVAFGLSIYLLVKFIPRFKATAGFWVCLFLLPIAAVFMVDKVKFNKK